jgi:hypothetical protein
VKPVTPLQLLSNNCERKEIIEINFLMMIIITQRRQANASFYHLLHKTRKRNFCFVPSSPATYPKAGRDGNEIKTMTIKRNAGNACPATLPAARVNAFQGIHLQHQARLAPRLALGSGPHASRLSQRWSRGQEASLMEILDAAIEISGTTAPNPLEASKSPKGRVPLPYGPRQGRE